MYKRNQYLCLRAGLIVLDTVAIGGALFLAYNLRFRSGLLPFVERYSPVQGVYVMVILMAIPIWILIFALNGLYDPHNLLGGPQEYAKVVNASSFGVLGLVVLTFFQRDLIVSRSWLLLSWLLATIFAGTARFTARRIVFGLRRQGLFITKVLIVGVNEQARAIANQLHSPSDSGVEVLGFVDDFLPSGTKVMGDLKVLGPPTALAKLAEKTDASEIIVVPSAMAWESFQETIQSTASALNSVEVKLSPGFYEILTTGVRVSHKNFIPLLTVEKVRLTGIDALLKTILDYGGGLLLTLLLAPLMAIVALLIKLSGPGPIVDPHPVVGCRGVTFRTWKFRVRFVPVSSKGGSTSSTAPELHCAHPLDRWLFRTGLDKLPQLFNLLRGQMSLVGPRNIPVERAAAYERWLTSLMAVKPGITGPWMVVGPDVDSVEVEIRWDIYYIRNWTIWLDLQILFQTLLRILRGQRPVGSR